MSDFRKTQQYLKNLQSARAGWSMFIEDFLEAMAFKCLSATKNLTPVDEGLLRDEWKFSRVTRQGDMLYVTIFNNLEYASYVEYGHWQRKRFLPIEHLDKGSKKGRKMASDIRSKYGGDTKGVMLNNKWIPGYFMATIPFNQIRQELPAQYRKQFKKYMQRKGVM